MGKAKRPAKNLNFFGEVTPVRTNFSKKISTVLNKTTAAFKPKARRLWGKPKPIKVSDLRAGDLAFSRFKTRLSEDIASAVTGFPQMHVSLYLGEGKFFDFSNKAKIVHASVLSNYYPELFIFRPKLSAEQKEKIVFLATKMAKSRVKRGERIRIIIGLQNTLGIKVKNPKEEGYLCSNSVAEFFSKAGVNLVPKVHPLRVSSIDLMKSKKLELING